jgi:hypothetical protein
MGLRYIKNSTPAPSPFESRVNCKAAKYMFLLLKFFVFFKRNYCKHLFSLLNICSFQMSGRICLKLLAGGLTVWTLVFFVTPHVNTLALSSFVPKAYRKTPIFRHPFFRKQCFSLNHSLVSPPQNFWRYV